MRQWINLFENQQPNLVSDKDGNPIVVYHGTGKDFDHFSADVEPRFYATDHGKIFFTSSEENAHEYAQGSDWDEKAPANPRVIRAHLKMHNPYVVNVEENPDNEWDQWGDLYAREAADDGHDGIIIETEDGSDRLYVVFSPDQVIQL